jgi:xanthine dehydrogenase YagS FAD-binding subunit
MNRIHAILGASSECVATHPSDMCVALAVLDASVHVRGIDGERTLPFADLHRLPGDRPDRDNALQAGELITSIELPPPSPASNSAYRKVRDRASYAFALVSVAAVVEMDGGRIGDVRIALGGVAHKPWRASKAEAALRGMLPTAQAFHDAATLEFEDAKPLRDNGFKIELARRTLVAVLGELTGTPS